MSFQVIPVFSPEPGFCSVTDELLADCWERIVKLGHDQTAFWAGTVKTLDAFQKLMHAPEIWPIVILFAGEPVLLAWLSPVPAPGWMNAHFCALAKYRPGAAEAGLDFWHQTGLIGVLGMIPETHKAALHFVEKLGWKRVGEVDSMCQLEDKRRVAGILHSYVFERS